MTYEVGTSFTEKETKAESHREITYLSCQKSFKVVVFEDSNACLLMLIDAGIEVEYNQLGLKEMIVK